MIGRLTKWQRIFGAFLLAFLVTETQLAYLSIRSTINEVYTDGIMVVERGHGYRVGHKVKGREALKSVYLLWRSSSAQRYAFRTAAVTPTFSTFYGQGVGPSPQNLEYLGFSQCDVAATSCGTCPVPAKDIAVMVAVISGYTNTAIASFRFNADSGTNYTFKYASAVAAATAWTVPAASVSQTFGKLFSTGVVDIARVALVTCMNRIDEVKVCAVSSLVSGAATGAATGPSIEAGGFVWGNTTAQITQIEFLPDANSLNANSYAMYFGKNLNAP